MVSLDASTSKISSDDSKAQATRVFAARLVGGIYFYQMHVHSQTALCIPIVLFYSIHEMKSSI